jgi:hypothetical protein
MPGLTIARPDIRRAVREVQRQIDAGQGGFGCPFCPTGKRHRNLAEAALSLATLHARNSTIHGPGHWGRVVGAGVYLAERDRRIDPRCSESSP